MADSKLELVVTVDADKANASIKSVNAGLSSIETTAVSAARGASRGIDGMTAAMVKGATAGNLLADAIKTALRWAKSWTIDAAKLAAHEVRLEASTLALARAHGVSAAAIENITAGEALEKLLLGILREGAKIQGAHAAASGEAEMMLKALGRQMHELREQVGLRFQKEFKDLIKLLKDAAQWATENADTLAKFARVAIEVATVLATYQLAKKIAELAGALSALSLASAGLRAGLVGAGVAALGFVLYEEKRKWDQRAALLPDDLRR